MNDLGSKATCVAPVNCMMIFQMFGGLAAYCTPPVSLAQSHFQVNQFNLNRESILGTFLFNSLIGCTPKTFPSPSTYTHEHTPLARLVLVCLIFVQPSLEYVLEWNR